MKAIYQAKAFILELVIDLYLIIHVKVILKVDNILVLRNNQLKTAAYTLYLLRQTFYSIVFYDSNNNLVHYSSLGEDSIPIDLYYIDWVDYEFVKLDVSNENYNNIDSYSEVDNK